MSESATTTAYDWWRMDHLNQRHLGNTNAGRLSD